MQRAAISIAGCVLCVLATAAIAQESASYRLTHVWTRSLDPAHENDEFEVHAVNDKGQLAGHRIPGGAFVWRNGTFENLAPVPALVSWATGIDEWSDVAGYYVNEQLDTSAFLRRGDNYIQIAQLPGETSLSTLHVNNRGEVLLSAIAGTELRHYVWRRGVRTLLARPPGQGITPVRINDSGVVAGDASGGGVSVPVLWHDGAVSPIALPEGAIQGSARDMNDAGVVVIDTFNATSDRSHRWRDGQYTDLGQLAGHSRTMTASINNAGVVVGSASGEPSNLTTATVWYDMQAHDLNALVHANDPLRPFVRLSFALHINDRGEIVARGVDERQGPGTVSHYLLTPRR